MKLTPREPYSYRNTAAVPRFDDSGPVVFMDGNCMVCTRTARLIAQLDQRGEFKICPVQSPLGQSVLVHYGLDPADPDSWLYLADGKAYTSLDAVMRTGSRLGGWGHAVQVFKILPRGAQDWVYRRIARNRYSIAGRADMCALPDASLKRRLLT